MKNIRQAAFQTLHDLLKAAKGDALLALLQTMQCRSRESELFGKLGKRHIATFLPQKRRELFFQSVTHPAMLANKLFRLRNNLFDGREINRIVNAMKVSVGKHLAVGLGLFLALAGGAQPVITSPPVNQTVFLGGNATFSIMVTGVGPFTYQWQLNGTNLPNNIITTVAGGNLFNNQQATNTILASPSGVARDSAGNFYIADVGNSVIRKVGTNGMATIVAGNGNASFTGDGGMATNAGLANPYAVIVDSNGNLLIADSNNNRIRKVDTNGVISTIAGGAALPFAPGDGGAATNAGIYGPVGLCLDSVGNLFIADQQNHRIRKVATTGIITTVAGTGTAGYNFDNNTATISQLNFPSGVVVDSSGNLFIADSSNNRIRKVNTSGTITTVAGTGTAGYTGDGGAATSARINNPGGVARDAAGNLLVVDSGNHCIRKMTNGIITTLAGNGTNSYAGDGGAATNASLSYPNGVVADSIGNLLIADAGNNRIRKVGTNGVIATVAGRMLNDGDFATNATLNVPDHVACDSSGNLFIADAGNNRIRKVDTTGIITTVAGNGLQGFSGDGGAATNGSLNQPNGVTVDSFGNLWIADTRNQRLRKVDTNGIITTVAGAGLGGFSGDGGAATNAKIFLPMGVVLDVAGNVLIADYLNNRIRKLDTNGNISTVAGTGTFGFSGDGGAATSATMRNPHAVTLDANSNFYFADFWNYRIRKVDVAGNISTVAGNGFGFSGDGGAATNANFNAPYAVTADPVGNFYIADPSYARVRQVNTNGIITTFAGNGNPGFAGDGGPSSNANLDGPRGMAVDGVGNVYISDGGNNRIRKVAYVDYADQSAFMVTNVTPASVSNNYSVIITSASGSVTSSVVTLNVQLPPIAPVYAASNGVYTFTWSAVSNLTYQLQCATNLAPPVWQDLGNPVTATNNTVSTTATNGADSQRFYRVRLWP